jgi:cytochrome c oxidase subunit 2
MPLFPEQASTFASNVDALYIFLVCLTAFFSLLIGGLVVVFAIKYRRRDEDEVPGHVRESSVLEITWTVIPLVICLALFVWSAWLFFRITRPPREAMDVYVTAKQWMWKLQHADGRMEMNELHVPIGRAVRLTMASEDVIHSFFVPAFRFKRDVVPGRFATAWFEATTPGRYHLFCAQYCGTRHSNMIGWVYVLTPSDYQAWLAGGTPGESLAATGAKRFVENACNTCHADKPGARGPSLNGIFGKIQRLQGGQTVLVDESYIRESIVNPQAKLVEGYPPIMPTFQGLISEETLLQLVAYIKSLSPAPGAAPGAPAPAAAGEKKK